MTGISDNQNLNQKKELWKEKHVAEQLVGFNVNLLKSTYIVG